MPATTAAIYAQERHATIDRARWLRNAEALATERGDASAATALGKAAGHVESAAACLPELRHLPVTR